MYKITPQRKGYTKRCNNKFKKKNKISKHEQIDILKVKSILNEIKEVMT